MLIALIGLGAIGVPIAHKIQKDEASDFILISDEDRKRKLKSQRIYINDEPFEPVILTDEEGDIDTVDLLIVCVKNYSLKNILSNIKPFIGEKTIILPLQNGVYSFDFFCKQFPENTIIRGYVQGPNTERVSNGFRYDNPGELHIGSDNYKQEAQLIVDYLKSVSINAFYEPNIVKMVWKKWMLNVAGNSITALTGADYSLFKQYSDLQKICRQAMMEFIQIAKMEGIALGKDDIDDIIKYYISYMGCKKTSMLMDVICEKKTENDYLAGTALKLAEKHSLNVPTIRTLYYLMEVKEDVYMERKGCLATDLYTEGVEYSDALRVQLNDIDRKMKDSDYADLISRGEMVEQLFCILKYAAENTKYYSQLIGFQSLKDFPVMDRESLKKYYNDIYVHNFDNLKTHKMYTSGSTGMPFTVIQDLAKRERNIADLKYFGKAAGYSDHDPMCYLRAKPMVSQSQQYKDNIWQLESSSLSERNLKDFYHMIVEKKCTALIGYPSTLDIAVDYWSKHYDNNTQIKTIISTSEALPKSTRNLLKSFFGNKVRIHARYSNSEQGILGQERRIEDEYELNWASYYFEILKFDSNDSASDGEIGRIVITDLYNRAFPMIRYDTGDTGCIVKRRGKLPVLTKLSGRKMDILFDVNGEPVSPFLISRTMRFSQNVKQWQFIQRNTSDYKLRVSYDGRSLPDLSTEINELKNTLGCSANIEIEYTDSAFITNTNDWKIIVSEL